MHEMYALCKDAGDGKCWVLAYAKKKTASQFAFDVLARSVEGNSKLWINSSHPEEHICTASVVLPVKPIGSRAFQIVV